MLGTTQQGLTNHQPIAEVRQMADIDSKACTKCGVVRPFSQFHKRATSKDGMRGQCIPCRVANAKEWIVNNRERYNKRIRDDRAVNPEKYKKWAKAYQTADVEHYRAIKRKWVEKNPEKRAEITAKYSKSNPHKILAQVRQRMAIKLRAIPAWSDPKAVELIYQKAAELSKKLAVTFEVDHVVPLRGKTVCGLHCEANMQLLGRTENRKKGHVQWPDMWE